MCMYVPSCHFSGILLLSPPPAAGLFSDELYRGLACTLRRKCGSRPGSVARAVCGRYKPRIWQVIAERPSFQIEPSRPIEAPSSRFSMYSPLLLFLKHHNNSPKG